jgi:phospholipase C
MRALTRRRLLGTAAAVAGAGALSASSLPLPAPVRAALAAEPPRRSALCDIEHVVLLMQENRSFDHYFGAMPGVCGFGDAEAITLPSGRSVFHQPYPQHPDGFLLPFRLDTRKTSAQSIRSTGHSWEVQHSAWNQGRMDNWIPAHLASDRAHGPYTMGYHTREDIPFQYALAEAFTVCDRYHCSVLGPTWPNRLHWMTGTIDPGGMFGGPCIWQGTTNGPFRWTTYAQRLQAAGISWRVYQEQDNFATNMLAAFAEFQSAKPGDPLYDNGMARLPAGTFEEDARNDRLPRVSWILPTSLGCEHPTSTPAEGAAFVASKIEAIASNPEVWRKTVFILSYDENDGLFDHVPPPVPPHGTPDEFINGEPIGAGFRVPAIIVSPWTAGGWVASEPFDHTSVLQFLEKITGVEEPNISDWRRQTFGDLTSAFRFTDPRLTFPALPDPARGLADARWGVKHLPAPALPVADQVMPVQPEHPLPASEGPR